MAFWRKNCSFAARCAEDGLIFIGPSAEVIARMGDKVAARQTAASLGIPVVPGSSEGFTAAAEAKERADAVGYPLLLKASAGGGGRGMRVVADAEAFTQLFEQASMEAAAAFGRPDVYLERFFPKVRHIEIQVFGDRHGNYVQLGERDCSVQRRHQKLVEEAPSPVLDQSARRAMADAALTLVRALDYVNAGTVEFIYEVETARFYFIEMNTRIQVEHPVTEMVTGNDLVAEQFRVAAGERLAVVPAAEDAPVAIEFRINAEDADHDFPAVAGNAQALAAAERARHPARQPRLRKLRGAAVLRLDARQADRDRPRPRGSDRNGIFGAGTVRRIRHRHHGAVSRRATAAARIRPRRNSHALGGRSDADGGALMDDGNVKQKTVRLVDVTLRDAHQCLWATRMTTAMMADIAPRLDRAGFEAIDLVGGAVFDVCVRYLREDPWERMRILSSWVKNTPLIVMTRGQSLFTFEFFPDDIVELTAQRIFANGIRYHTPYDALNDMRNMEVPVRAAKKVGLYTAGGVVYTLSPVHTDDYYARKTRELIKLGVDAVYIKDPSGLLTPERAHTLVPALKAACGALPLHLHSHCLTGLAPYTAIRAVELGVDVVHTATSTLANGASHPATESFVHNVRREGLHRASRSGAGRRSRRAPAVHCRARGQAGRAYRRTRRLSLRASDAWRHGVQSEVAAGAARHRPSAARRARGSRAGASRSRLSDHRQPVRAIRHDPGRAQRHGQGALCDGARRGA